MSNGDTRVKSMQSYLQLAHGPPQRIEASPVQFVVHLRDSPCERQLLPFAQKQSCPSCSPMYSQPVHLVAQAAGLSARGRLPALCDIARCPPAQSAKQPRYVICGVMIAAAAAGSAPRE